MKRSVAQLHAMDRKSLRNGRNDAGEIAMKYTLASAAEAVGRDKSTIQRAIKNGKITASKDPHGEYQIDPSELHRVYPLATGKRNDSNDTQRKASGAQRSDLERAIRDLELKLAVSEARNEQLEKTSESLRETKDVLQDTVADLRRRLDQSEAARLALTDQRTIKQRPFWQFWNK